MNCQACGHENVEEARFCAACGAALPARVESQNDPLIGQVIGGRYRITGIIGEGGMGVVYVGEQQMGSTIRKVAVKTLHPHLSKDTSVLKRFHRECGTVAQLEHPNTIKVYDFGSTPDGTLYIAMEFVAGRALSDVLLNEGKLAPERVIQILRQICGALDEAHDLGIVHRDLKPDNIILTPRAGEQDFVKVLDFGIAARTESADAAHEQKLTQQGTVLGTPPYMSPEQFTGKSLDRRSDVYSLGVMVYEMLTGKLPFDAETPWQWATQHMTAQPRPFEAVVPQVHIANGMCQTVLRALSKDCTQRQASAGKFFAELSAGLKADPEATPMIGASSANAYQATAAMPEMRGFGDSPQMSPAAPHTTATPVASTLATAAVSPGVAMPVIALPKPRSVVRLGLVLGLSGTGLAIAATMVVVSVRSNKPTNSATAASTASSAAAAATATATLSAEIPQASASQLSAQTPPPVESSLPISQRKASSKAAATTHPGASTATASPQNKSTPNPMATPAQQPQPMSQNNRACENCIALASEGDMSGAARNLGACTDPEGQSRCIGRARAGALIAAQTALRNHDCAKVSAIAAAAESMGAITPALRNAANNCR